MMKNHWKDFHSALYLHKCDYCTDQKLYRDKCKHFSAMFTLQHSSFTMKKFVEIRNDLVRTGSGKRKGKLTRGMDPKRDIEHLE